MLHGKLKGTEQEMVVSIPGVHSQDELGAVCGFTIDTEHIHLFAQPTGKRIKS